MTDPIDDETKPHATSSTNSTPDDPTASASQVPDGGGASTPEPGLRVDPERPADSGWREPAWFPPRAKDRGPNIVAVILGLVLIVIGLYFFLDRTLGVTMPRIQWSTIWPILLIGLGAIVIFRSVRRRS